MAGAAKADAQSNAFWQAVFAKAGQHIDIANIHSIGSSPVFNVPAFRELLSRSGIDKPIWVTEAQLGSGPTAASPQDLAVMFTKAYVTSFALGTEKVFYTSYRAPPGAAGPNRDQFERSALIGSDGTKRPVYFALRTLVSQLGPFTSVKTLADGQYRFEVGARRVYVLWGTGNAPPEITGQVQVTDISGNQSRVEAVALRLSSSPIYVQAAAP
jgi:hypothetical protein